jgi:hypothetical protein
MDYEAEIKQAEADLAFALAQGDGMREDEATARIEALKDAQWAADRLSK